MPAVLMENPKHGRHHFYSPQEVEVAKSNGWVVVEPEPAAKPEPEVEQAPEPVAKPAAKKAAKKARR